MAKVLTLHRQGDAVGTEAKDFVFSDTGVPLRDDGIVHRRRTRSSIIPQDGISSYLAQLGYQPETIRLSGVLYTEPYLRVANLVTGTPRNPFAQIDAWFNAPRLVRVTPAWSWSGIPTNVDFEIADFQETPTRFFGYSSADTQNKAPQEIQWNITLVRKE